jgi:hypothetical protein
MGPASQTPGIPRSHLIPKARENGSRIQRDPTTDNRWINWPSTNAIAKNAPDTPYQKGVKGTSAISGWAPYCFGHSALPSLFSSYSIVFRFSCWRLPSLWPIRPFHLRSRRFVAPRITAVVAINGCCRPIRGVRLHAHASSSLTLVPFLGDARLHGSKTMATDTSEMNMIRQLIVVGAIAAVAFALIRLNARRANQRATDEAANAEWESEGGSAAAPRGSGAPSA